MDSKIIHYKRRERVALLCTRTVYPPCLRTQRKRSRFLCKSRNWNSAALSGAHRSRAACCDPYVSPRSLHDDLTWHRDKRTNKTGASTEHMHIAHVSRVYYAHARRAATRTRTHVRSQHAALVTETGSRSVFNAVSALHPTVGGGRQLCDRHERTALRYFAISARRLATGAAGANIWLAGR